MKFIIFDSCYGFQLLKIYFRSRKSRAWFKMSMTVLAATFNCLHRLTCDVSLTHLSDSYHLTSIWHIWGPFNVFSSEVYLTSVWQLMSIWCCIFLTSAICRHFGTYDVHLTSDISLTHRQPSAIWYLTSCIWRHFDSFHRSFDICHLKSVWQCLSNVRFTSYI